MHNPLRYTYLQNHVSDVQRLCLAGDTVFGNDGDKDAHFFFPSDDVESKPHSFRAMESDVARFPTYPITICFLLRFGLYSLMLLKEREREREREREEGREKRRK